MLYKGSFYDKDNTKLYQLTINVDDGDSAEQELLFSGNPFTTDLENSDNTIFKPVKYQSATIGLLAFEDDYKFNLYSATAQHNKVTLTDGETVKWVGYVTPSLYDIGYEARYEDLDIDCIDGLSTLQYYKYEALDDMKSSKSLLDIILHILKKCNCYNNLYIQKNVTLDNEEELYHRLYLNQSLFFEDDADIEDGVRITDDDDTYKDALEKILTYLGVTLYAEGEDCYIVDFDCLKQRKSEYYKVSILDGTIQPTEQQYSYSINQESYQTNNQTLSLTKVYNKVTVKDEFRTIKSIFPDIYSPDDLEKFYPIESFPTYLSPGEALFCNNANIGTEGTNYGLYQFFNNKNIKFYSYDKDGNLQSMENQMKEQKIQSGVQRDNILTGQNGNGCCICKAHLYNGERYEAYPLVVYTKEPLPYFTFDNYVLFTLGKDKEYNTEELSSLDNPYYVKMFETDLQLGQLVGTENMYFIISGNFMYYDEANIFGLVGSYQRKKDTWNKENFWIPCSLKYQNQWWNGTDWQSSFCKFKLFCNSDVEDHYLGKNMEIINSVPWLWNIKKTGAAIKLPDNVIDNDSPKFAIYRPASPSYKYRIDQLWMKDFNIELAILNQDDELADDSDTKYTNIINLDHTEELGEIKVDVCTYDNKTIADNCVTYYNGSKFVNLDKVNHIVLNSVLDGQQGRFEEYICCKIAYQYEQPKIMLKVTLKDDLPTNTLVYESNLNKWFIIDGKSANYRFKEFTYTLIEKK